MHLTATSLILDIVCPSFGGFASFDVLFVFAARPHAPHAKQLDRESPMPFLHKTAEIKNNHLNKFSFNPLNLTP